MRPLYTCASTPYAGPAHCHAACVARCDAPLQSIYPMVLPLSQEQAGHQPQPSPFVSLPFLLASMPPLPTHPPAEHYHQPWQQLLRMAGVTPPAIGRVLYTLCVTAPLGRGVCPAVRRTQPCTPREPGPTPHTPAAQHRLRRCSGPARSALMGSPSALGECPHILPNQGTPLHPTLKESCREHLHCHNCHQNTPGSACVHTKAGGCGMQSCGLTTLLPTSPDVA
jgi:hypothetical protein